MRNENISAATDTGPLSPYRVLDLSGELGWLCGKILGDLGADVVKVEPPAGDPSRLIGPFCHDRRDPHACLPWLAFNTSKRGITLDLDTTAGQNELRRLVALADFLIETFPPGYLRDRGLDWPALREINPALVMVSITPFGQTGPYASYMASDLEIMALSGCMSLTGAPDGAPLRVGDPQARYWASTYAVFGALIAHLYRQSTGIGQHVDVSAQQAALWADVHAPIAYDLNGEVQRRAGSSIVGRSVQGAVFRTIWPCKDGYITFTMYGGAAGKRTNQGLCRWMAERGMAPDWFQAINWSEIDVTRDLSPAEVQRCEQAIGAFFLTLTKQEFFSGVIARDMLGYPVATAADLLADPQLEARGFWQYFDHPDLGVRLPYPGPFARFALSGPSIRRLAPRIGEHNGQIEWEARTDRGDSQYSPFLHASPPREPGPGKALQGLRVVEFGAFAAGPVVGKHLADYGAEVIKIESRSRPDGFRAHYPPYKDNRWGLERSGLFAMSNNGKRSVTLNLKHPEGARIARELVRRADVVVENFTPGTMARLGLAYEHLVEVNPQLVMLSTCNQGQSGPHAHHPGFGTHLSSLAGFTALMGYPGGEPQVLYGPYIDYIAVGYGVVAVLAALEYRARTGKGQYIDMSQYETGVQWMAAVVMDYVANGREIERRGNRHPEVAPHGAYRCQGEDEWCVISVWDEAEWERLCHAMGDPEWTRDPRFATMASRKVNEDALDAHLEEWTIQRSPRQVMAELQAAGVHAAAVNDMADLFTDPQLAHRHTWWRLLHPEIGEHSYEAAPFILSETPARLEEPAPLLGQHLRSVLTGLLGMTDAEIDRLAADGVFD